MPGYGDRAPVRPEEAAKHSDRGGLSGPVRTEKAEEFAGVDAERNVIDGNHAVESLGKSGCNNAPFLRSLRLGRHGRSIARSQLRNNA